MKNLKTKFYENVYDCPCGENWSEEADSTCDDRCPSCNTPCSPSESHFTCYKGEFTGLNFCDVAHLGEWLRSKAPLKEVIDTASVGLVGNRRFSDRAKHWYFFIWKWSAVRFSEELGASSSQERFTDKRGYEALTRRINRIKRLAENIARQ